MLNILLIFDSLMYVFTLLQNSYCLRYDSAALVGFVYIGNLASHETNKSAMTKAETFKWDEVIKDDRKIFRVS